MQRTASLAPTTTVRANVSSPWTGPLAPDIALNVPTAPVDNARTLRLEAIVGWWGTLPVAIAVLVAMILVAVA